MAATAPTQKLIATLDKKRRQARADFKFKHKQAHLWLKKRQLAIPLLREHSAKLLTGATLGGAILLTSPQMPILKANTLEIVQPYEQAEDFLKLLVGLPATSFYPDDQEKLIEVNIRKFYGVSAAFVMDGNRLPTYVGMMGLEQHLLRFPGDTLSQHTTFQQAGMAPLRGAFGYFAETGKPYSQMEAEEMYYLVLQTLLIPNWNRDWARLKDWYKFRKFLVINPESGKAVVAVLGDSGPATWTGKQFGGSPEVMAALGYYPQTHKGEVLVVFLDNPANEVPLGPVSLKGGGYGQTFL